MSRSRQAPAQSSAPRPPKRPAERRPERGPGARGWPGAGGGKTSLLEAPPEFRATTVQVCGLWPWIVGSGVPLVGVPLGRHLFSRATVCSDPINWFSRGGLIANPSVLVLGRPGLGKSTLVCRMCLGLDYYGYRSVVLGDLKPDYAELTSALGGNVVTLGRGHGTLNVLDPGAAVTAANRLTGRARAELEATDSRRAEYIRRYYDRDWADRRLYHMMINSCMGCDAMIEAVLDGAGMAATGEQVGAGGRS